MRSSFLKSNNLPAVKNARKRRFDLRKGLLIISGLFLVGLAGLGVILPILPTTPFLLAAAACFVRSSDPLYQWLIHHRLFGSYLRNYMKHTAISPRAKSISLVLLWTTICLSAFFTVSIIWVRIILFIIALLVSLRILFFKTLTREMLEDS